jgi:hypothetical protein
MQLSNKIGFTRKNKITLSYIPIRTAFFPERKRCSGSQRSALYVAHAMIPIEYAVVIPPNREGRGKRDYDEGICKRF